MSKLEELIQQYCPDGVNYTPLKEICRFQNGFAFKSSLFRTEGLPVLRITNISEQKINDNDLVFFDKKDYKEDLKQYIVRKGDVVVAMSGATTGKIGYNYSDNEYYLNQRVGMFVPEEEKLDKRYLYHWLTSMCETLLNISQGSGAQPNLSSQKTMELEIPLPAKTVQKEIVQILDKFSALPSELTNELIGRQKQYEYYRDKLFKDILEKSKEVKLEDLCKLITKQTGFDYSNTIKKSLIRDRKENTIPYIQTKHFNGKTFDYNTDYYIPSKTAGLFPKIVLNEKCILFSIVGASIGNVGLFSNEETCFLGGAICVAKVKEEYNIDYLYYCIESEIVQKQIKSKTKGAGQATITVEDIRNFVIPIPTKAEQERLVRLLDSFNNLINNKSFGLPAEIEARQKQYEYYRDKLLSFERR